MIPKWLHNSTIAVYDIETDRIPTTLMYMIGVSIIAIDDNGNTTTSPSKLYTMHWTKYSDGSFQEALNVINSCTYQCGHNIEGFDKPQIGKYLGSIPVPTSLDTLILAKIIYSKDELYSIDAKLDLLEVIDWSKPYALDAFGKRLGHHKLDFHEFDEMTEEMAIYCKKDVDLTAELILFLFKSENFPLQQVVDIEHQTAAIITEQAAMGFYLDIDMADDLNTKMLQEKMQIHQSLLTEFKPKFLKKGKVISKLNPIKSKRYEPSISYVDPWPKLKD